MTRLALIKPDAGETAVADALAAVALAGRIIEEQRVRLLAAEHAVTRLEGEQRALKAELRAIVELAAHQAGIPARQRPSAA